MGEQKSGHQSLGASAASARSPATLEGITAAWQEASEALRDSERRYRELVEYSLGLICTHDLTGNILSINPAAANSLGYQPEDGIGHNLREFLSADTRHLFDEYLRRIQEHGHDTGLMRVVARAGTERVWMYRNVLSHGPGGAYVLGHAIDVTDRVADRTNAAPKRTGAAKRAERARGARQGAHRRSGGSQRAAARRDCGTRGGRAFAPTSLDRTTRYVGVPGELLRSAGSARHLRGSGRSRAAPAGAIPRRLDDGARGQRRWLGSLRARRPRGRDAGAAAGRGRSTTPATLDSQSHLGQVIATGRVAILTLTAEDAASRLIGPTMSVSALERLGAGTAAMLPLVLDGRVKGVLSLISTRAASIHVVGIAGRRGRRAPYQSGARPHSPVSRGAGGQSPQGRIPGHAVARAPHAAQCHFRMGTDSANQGPRRTNRARRRGDRAECRSAGPTD